MFRCRIIRDFRELGGLAQPWDELVQRSDFNDVFATSGFARAWWRAFGNSRLLKLVVVEDESSRPKLIAPFYADQSAPGVLRLIGSFRGDYNNLVFAQADHASVAALFNWLGRYKAWEVIRIHRIPEVSSFLQHLPGPQNGNVIRWQRLWVWLDARYPLVTERYHTGHYYMGRAKLLEFSDILARQANRKEINWFSRQGDLRYRCVRQPEEIRRLLPPLMKMHVSQWASMGENSLFEKAENRRFYEYLLEEFAGTQALRFDALLLDEKLIAAHFGFNWDGRVYYYKPCYDLAFASHSPGRLLFSYIIRDAVESGAKELDMLSGAEAYKKKYASAARRTSSMWIYRSRLNALQERLGPAGN